MCGHEKVEHGPAAEADMQHGGFIDGWGQRGGWRGCWDVPEDEEGGTMEGREYERQFGRGNVIPVTLVAQINPLPPHVSVRPLCDAATSTSVRELVLRCCYIQVNP